MELNLRETELCLGLPGGGGDTTAATVVGNKRGYLETVDLKLNLNNGVSIHKTSPKEPTNPPSKAQVVGWPPVRSYRKNVMVTSQKGNGGSVPTTVDGGEKAARLVKVSMDGAPYLRKVDLKIYKSYIDLSNALATMFASFTIRNNNNIGGDIMKESSEYVPSYEDKDGDWMLVGDVPWEMFVESCKRVRIMKGSEAIGLAPRAMECESRV